MFGIFSQKRLIKNAKQGDHFAFERLVKPQMQPVYRSAFYLAGGKEDLAWDLFQTTFTRAFISFDTFIENAPLKPWLNKILHNAFYDHLGKNKKKKEILVDSIEEFPAHKPAGIVEKQEDPLENLMVEETKKCLHELIGQLSPKLREIIILCEIQEMTNEEVQIITGLPEGTIKSRLYRSREALKKIILQNRELFFPAGGRG